MQISANLNTHAHKHTPSARIHTERIDSCMCLCVYGCVCAGECLKRKGLSVHTDIYAKYFAKYPYIGMNNFPNKMNALILIFHRREKYSIDKRAYIYTQAHEHTQ